MMEDDFYCSLKLITGEEIFSKVSATEENDTILLILSDPIIITEIKTKQGIGYKIEPWMKTTTDDMFIIDISRVLTMTESYDDDMIEMHQKYVNKKQNNTLENDRHPNMAKVTKQMGYINNVNEAKLMLEKIYNNS
jgi:hypothetical protein